MAEEEFSEYMERHGLNEHTIRVLADNGFVGRDSLSVMEVADIVGIKVKPLGQRRLLERLLKQKDSAESPEAPQDVSVAASPAEENQ